MNGTWVSWHPQYQGGGSIGVERYVKAWRRVFNIAKAVDAENIAFVWAPALEGKPTSAYDHQSKFYPGDDYVHWVGQSTYNYAGSTGVGDSVSKVIDDYPHKPFMITEGATPISTSCDWTTPGVDPLDWMEELFDVADDQVNYPSFKGMFWFYVDKECNFKFEDKATLLSEYKNRVKSSRYLSTMVE